MLSSLPNLLTLSRILAVPALVVLMWNAGWLGYLGAFVLFCIAGATDYLDGYLARAQGAVSKLGQFLDPIADKIMVAATILMLIENDIVKGASVVAALVILIREITVSGLREYLAGLQVSVPVSQLAKWKTTLQMVALGALILEGFAARVAEWIPAHQVGIVCLWAAAILTLITGYDYLRVGLKHMA
jgi:CDP-diacylglycerol--glycerol-3-phosphate 3-phosphatidyltransferase/cardiolipin synthase